jgi:ascorbate-specific PTS system EIIC-type component UlaA
MANHDEVIQTTRGQGHMLQAAILLGACLFIGLIALAVCAWVAVSGRLFTMDGLLMVAISLAAATFFVGNFAWSLHTGEVREILSQLRGATKESGTASDSAGEGKA